MTVRYSFNAIYYLLFFLFIIIIIIYRALNACEGVNNSTTKQRSYEHFIRILNS